MTKARWTRIGVVASLLIGATAVVSTQFAGTDPLAAARTVSADPLPTVQINGVAWSQVVVGSTVYVGGSFTRARPAGSAIGQNETPRSNFLAYDITTGQLDTTFAPTFNAQVRAVAASPDGTRLYVAGDFTVVNGLRRDRVAAFDLRTGQLIGTFLPPVAYNAHALAVTDTTVYVGGNFNAVGNQVRKQLAAFRASDGALLDWAPQATGGLVRALALSPDGRNIAVGGHFTLLNNSSNPGFGLAIVDAVTGALQPMAVNNVVRNAGNTAAITSLHSDGSDLYGTGFWMGGTGRLEGTFSASWDGGTINWISDCQGDTYSVHTLGDAVYTASHNHNCRNMGSFPETSPRSYWYANALTREAVTVLAAEPGGYWNFGGQPAPAALPWFPIFSPGSYTQTYNGPWHITGNDRYVVVGGEFTQVDGKPQQGLVRFAVRSVAPNKMVPRLFLANWIPTLSSLSAGTVRIQWGENWDFDDDSFTYRVEREGTWPPIATVNGTSMFFDRGTRGVLERGLQPGATHRYRVVAIDPWGNEAPSNWASVTVASGGVDTYPYTVLADDPLHYWRLGESSGVTRDLASADHLTLSGTLARGAAGAISGDPDASVTFTNGTGSVAASRIGRDVLSVEAWFRTTSSAGGAIFGFGNAKTGASSRFDRALYVGTDGKLYFGVRRVNTRSTVSTTGRVNDGTWRHVVGTLSRGTMRLYVDGVLVGERDGVVGADVISGFWRVGGDSTSGWPAGSTATAFAGSVDEVAVYTEVLTPAQVLAHFQIGSTGVPPTTTTTTIAPTTTPTTVAPTSTTTTTTTLPPPPPPAAGSFVTDAFGRTTTNGWGTPDVGTPWTVIGPPARFSVDGTTGRITLDAPGLGVSAYTDGTPAGSSATDLRATVGVDKSAAGGSIFISLAGRHVGVHDYRVKLRIQPNGTVQAILNRVVGAETVLADTIVPGLTVNGPTTFEVRLQVAGTNPTTINVKVWPTGTPEPATWLLTTTDSTAELQTPGGIGLVAYLSTSASNMPVTITIDNLVATRL